jgi:PKD repeat protein
MHQPTLKSIGTLAAAVLISGCTMKDQDAPPLTGPSEFGKSVTLAVDRDVLPMDGTSSSVVTVTVRDPNAQPLRNESLRMEIRVNGVAADFGTISDRNVVTGANGTATLRYTAPVAPAVLVESFTIVDIVATPVGSDFNNAVSRSAAIRLVPPGGVIPPGDLRPAFTVTPSAPSDNQTVLFDASTSSGAIVEYQWNFGDGATATGRLAAHAYGTPGTYVVTLTLVDPFGRMATTAQSITVSAALQPTASFVFSPTNPRVGQNVNFNASASRAPAGSTIVSYTWDFGDGTPRVTTPDTVVGHTYALPATYTVTLLITDQAGRIATSSLTIQIAP